MKKCVLAASLALLFIGSLGSRAKSPTPIQTIPATIVCGSVTYLSTKEDNSGFDGTDPATVLSRPGDRLWNGYLFDRYYVEALSNTMAVGADIIVYYRPEGGTVKEALDPGQRKSWDSFMLPGVEDDNGFAGIHGDFMLVDQGCCPEPRGLELYDLIQKKRVHVSGYCSPIGIADDVLTYWAPTRETVTPKNCPDYEKLIQTGNPLGIEELVRFDLETLKLERTGKKRCSLRQ